MESPTPPWFRKQEQDEVAGRKVRGPERPEGPEEKRHRLNSYFEEKRDILLLMTMALSRHWKILAETLKSSEIHR